MKTALFLLAVSSSVSLAYTKDTLPASQKIENPHTLIFVAPLYNFLITPFSERPFQQTVFNNNSNLTESQKSLGVNYSKKINNLYFDNLFPKELDLTFWNSSHPQPSLAQDNVSYRLVATNIEPSSEKMLLSSLGNEDHYFAHAPKANVSYQMQPETKEGHSYQVSSGPVQSTSSSYQLKVFNRPAKGLVPNQVFSLKNGNFHTLNLETERGKLRKEEHQLNLSRLSLFAVREGKKVNEYGLVNLYLNDFFNCNYKIKQLSKRVEIYPKHIWTGTIFSLTEEPNKKVYEISWNRPL